mmetsp:Transcript_28585/g.92013  ORF Transcript_28585/g.92013 Transcript_28585/m.92013 type:complete len:254 (-) Transcript_28585:192-953(-)
MDLHPETNRRLPRPPEAPPRRRVQLRVVVRLRLRPSQAHEARSGKKKLRRREEEIPRRRPRRRLGLPALGREAGPPALLRHHGHRPRGRPRELDPAVGRLRRELRSERSDEGLHPLPPRPDRGGPLLRRRRPRPPGRRRGLRHRPRNLPARHVPPYGPPESDEPRPRPRRNRRRLHLHRRHRHRPRRRRRPRHRPHAPLARRTQTHPRPKRRPLPPLRRRRPQGYPGRQRPQPPRHPPPPRQVHPPPSLIYFL